MNFGPEVEHTDPHPGFNPPIPPSQNGVPMFLPGREPGGNFNSSSVTEEPLPLPVMNFDNPSQRQRQINNERRAAPSQARSGVEEALPLPSTW
jgi:hypothetical protein